MPTSNTTEVLSDVYEFVNSDELMQGDILLSCPVFIPPKQINLSTDSQTETPDIEIEMGYEDVVVMSQSCDLQAGQKEHMQQVILCPIYELSDLEKSDNFLASSYGKEMCRRGNIAGYHMIHDCDHDLCRRELSIVNFRDIYSLPLDFLRNFAVEIGNRARIRSPFREHLAQAFARYFMRVGLPVDIAPFKGPNAEEKIIKKLDALDHEAKNRILSYFQ
jgi:hypothetical protein